MSLLSQKDYNLAIEAIGFFLKNNDSLKEGKLREAHALKQWLTLEQQKKFKNYDN